MDEQKSFDLALKAWPSGAVDSRKDALKAWRALSTEDRLEASNEIDRFVSTNRSAGRTMICGFATYLREQRWKALPDRPKPTPATTAATERRVPRPQPTAFQRANPQLYPELFGAPATDGGKREAAP